MTNKQPLDSSKIGVPVPTQPANFQEAMVQLRKPLQSNNTVLQRAMEMKNKLLPYSTMPPLDLKKSLSNQVLNAQKIQQKNVEEVQERRKAASDLADLGIKYNQALLQQQLTERGLYTKQATEQLMASQQRANEILEMKIDPGRFFKDMPTWQKIVGFVGVVAAGVLNARAGYDPNQAFVGISNLIEQDVQEQTRDLEWAKYKDEKISMMDSKKLDLMAETLEARNHARSNLTALTAGYIKNTMAYMTDKSAISNMNSLTNTMYKTAANEMIKALIESSALKKQSEKAKQMEWINAQHEEFVKRSWARFKNNPNAMMLLGGPSRPGDVSKVEQIRHGTLPEETKAHLQQSGAYNRLVEVAKVEDEVKDIQLTKGEWTRNEKIKAIRNWVSAKGDVYTMNPNNAVRGLTGNYGYLKDMSPSELRRFRDVFNRMEPMKKLARALIQVDGYIEMAGAVPPQEAGQDVLKTYIKPYVEKLAKDKGLDFNSLSAKQKSDLSDEAFDQLNDEKIKDGFIKSMFKGVGIGLTGLDKEKVQAQHLVQLNARIAVASVVRLISAEGGIKISDIEWARTARGVTGTDDLNNFSVQDMNPWDTMEKTRTALAYLMHVLNNAQNAALATYLDTSQFPRDTDNLPYNYKALAYDMSKMPSNDVYNIIYELQKNFGLDATRLAEIPILQSKASAFYQRKMGPQGPVYVNKEFIRLQLESESGGHVPQLQHMLPGAD